MKSNKIIKLLILLFLWINLFLIVGTVNAITEDQKDDYTKIWYDWRKENCWKVSEQQVTLSNGDIINVYSVYQLVLGHCSASNPIWHVDTFLSEVYNGYYTSFSQYESYKRDQMIAIWKASEYYGSSTTSICYNGITVELVSAAPPVPSCSTQPWYTHAAYVVWSPTSANQARQKTNSSACYYYCTDWYTWTTCNTKTTTSTWWNCNQYISSRVEDWSDCEINSNWSSGWTITCEQINTWLPVYSYCWIWDIEYETICSGSCGCSTCLTNEISRTCSAICSNVTKPNNVIENKTISINLNWVYLNTCNISNNYANNEDICSFDIKMSWNTNQNKQINWLWWNSVKNIIDNSGESSDRISWLWQALNFDLVPNTSLFWLWTAFSFNVSNIKSVSPFNSNNWGIKFDIEWQTGFTTISLNGIDYDFNKPYTWTVNILWDDLKIWTEQTLELTPGITSCSNCDWLYLIDNYSNSLDVTDSTNYIIQNINWETGLNSSPLINSTINFIWYWLLWSTELKTNPNIWYNLWGEQVRYVLSNTNSSSDDSYIISWTSEFIWVKIIWDSELSGKYEITWQDENISSTIKSDIRKDLRESAYRFISSMNSWDVINWVKYVEWNIEISWNISYETLVVKNWNVTITDNLNTSWNKLWIIVLKDWYNTDIDFSNWGNIYINSNVTYINALIYSDWGIISSDYIWNPFLTDSTERTAELSKQLILKWSIFSRNTVGWAILSGDYYLLPGWSKTTDFNKAMLYDLNYIRRGNNWCKDTNSNGVCDDFSDAFIVTYNSDIHNNPPKLFFK